jgi:hypothetical protein
VILYDHPGHIRIERHDTACRISDPVSGDFFVVPYDELLAAARAIVAGEAKATNAPAKQFLDILIAEQRAAVIAECAAACDQLANDVEAGMSRVGYHECANRIRAL